MKDLISVGPVQAVHTTTGRVSGYRLEARHNGLHEHRLFRAPDQYVLQGKLDIQLAAWEEKWRQILLKAAVAESKIKSKERADILSADAVAALDQAKGLLAHAATSVVNIPWKKLEDVGRFEFEHGGRFPRTVFGKDGKPISVAKKAEPREPSEGDFPPRLTFFCKILPPMRRARLEEARKKFARAHADWRSELEDVTASNRDADEEYNKAKLTCDAALRDFEDRRAAATQRVTDLKQRYESGEQSAVTSVAELVLSESKYPDWIRRDSSTGYNPDGGLLIIEDTLPDIEAVPRLSRVTYVASRDEMRTTYINDAERDRLYDAVLYQIALRCIYEIFIADAAQVIKSIVYNGWLTWVNKATGVEETGCLLSLQASRDEMARIDLSKVEPKACFKQLKGISAAKLSGVTPIAPIVRMDTSDARFIASHEVAGHLEEGVNLASIDWEDFEHLVREIFEREFAGEGSEVKVTRASADGGVDAVVFDPDPIRGGKIVIQAKRYTATVGVSAVRDLWGTVMNEGAMKGILVTTSDYGPDSYHFAKDKPITLLNGGNLLQMMGKHGHKARIDLAEARRLRVAG